MAYPRRRNAHLSTHVAVTASSTVIVPNWDSRLRITITNNSAQDVSLKLRVAGAVVGGGTPADPTAVVNDGIVLKASGGSWTEDAYTGPIAAISASSTVAVAVTEI